MDDPTKETLKRCADCGELGWLEYHPLGGYLCALCYKFWEDRSTVCHN
jgi:hypothetical protein